MFHVFLSDPVAGWPATTPQVALAKIRNMLDERLAAEGIRLEGPGPFFTDEAGRLVNIANIVGRCLTQRHAKWPSYIDDFAQTTKLLAFMEDPLAIGADVVRASLRLRLVDDTSVNGWNVSDGDNDELPTERAEPAEKPSVLCALDEIAALVLFRPAMPGARWNLYLQRPGAGHGVIADHLQRWGIDEDEAFEIARNNAEQITPDTRARRFGTFWESGHSMFTHNRILFPERIVPNTSRGWFVSAPTRSDVFVAPASGDSTGFSRLGHLIKSARELWTSDPYPASRHCWYVPAEGIGRFGCDAEAIVLTDESLPGEHQPDVHVRFGDQLHQLFGELTPVRPAPRRVI